MACELQVVKSPPATAHNLNEPHPPGSPSRHRLQVQVVGSGDNEVDGSLSTPTYSSRLHPVLGSQGFNKVQSHRQQIVREIYDTEHSYISQLTTIVTLFLKPIRVGCLLPQTTILAIFSNVEAILSVNQELFASMRKKSLGEAFSYLGPFLKLYSTYAENYQRANETLQDCLKQDSDFTSFVQSTEARPECCGLRLSSLLITPVQRVPRYRLLLDDLLKHTKRSHTDFNKLRAASAQVASVTAHINEHVRKHENFQKMLTIQQSLVGPSVPVILSPARSFIHEGRLMKVCRTFKYKKASERMVFLFSDILVYAKPFRVEKKETQRCYECRCVLPLLHSTTRLISEDQRAPDDTTQLMEVSNSESDTSLVFYSLDRSTVIEWVDKIHNTIRELQAKYSSLVSQQDAAHRGSVADQGEAGSTVPSPLDLNTLTRETPYPLMATLFSPQPKDRLSFRDTPTNTVPIGNERLFSSPQDNKQLDTGEDNADPGCEERATPSMEVDNSRDIDRLIEGNSQSADLWSVTRLNTVHTIGNNQLNSKCCTLL